MSYFVYMLECADKTFYIGYTTNLAKRVLAHITSKKGAKYTRTRLPVKLLYFETFKILGEALKREYKLKQLSRPEKSLLKQSFQRV